MAKTVGIGIIGFGGFGMFAAQQLAQVPGITLRAIASTNREDAMFVGWLGEGRIESAGHVLRPGSGIEEQVYCTVRYGDVPVNFYHGFTQAGRMDRQEMRLLFERGDVETLYFDGERALSARHKKYEAYQKITLTSAPSTKMTLYGDLLRYMLTDQISYLTDRSHTRILALS